MYCTTCGKPNNDGATFCAHCGAKVDAPPSKRKQLNVGGETSSPESKSGQKSVLVWVALCISVVGIVLCFFPYAAWLGWLLVCVSLVLAIVVVRKRGEPRAAAAAALTIGITGIVLLILVSFASYLKIPQSYDEIGKSVLADYVVYREYACSAVPSMAIVDTFQPDLYFDCILSGGVGEDGTVVEVQYNWYTGFYKWGPIL